MKKALYVATTVAVMASSATSYSATLSQDFSSNPFADGWKSFGNDSLFNWNPASHNLEVTWDSTQPNSYFYHPLGTTLSRNEDFLFSFDLLLKDIQSGNETGKTGGLEIGIGLLNLQVATNSSFMRGVFGGAPGIVEFDYFPPGYFVYNGDQFDVSATTTPTLVSTNSYNYAPTIYAPYIVDLPTNIVIHVSLAYTASNQTATATITTNGVPIAHLPDVVLTDPSVSGFAAVDDFRVNAFSINSYSSTGDDYDSVLGHGTVGNIVVTYSMPVERFTGKQALAGWQGQFLSRSNWVYALERSTNLISWTAASGSLAGTATWIAVQDSSPPGGQAFYRVRAFRTN